MIITNDILLALKLAIKKAGTQELLSKKTGIRQDFFSKCLNHKVKSISLEKWLKIGPCLEPFLDKKEQDINSPKLMDALKSFQASSGKLSGPQLALEKLLHINKGFVDQILTLVKNTDLDPYDKPTTILLEYWRDLKQPQRYMLLKAASEILEKQKEELLSGNVRK